MGRFLPTREQIRNHRWLRWIGPRLQHPRLWRWSRHGVALGVALGVFFGLLIPVAQIPVSAGAAVALRANLPAAIASTLVTNPVTFGPIYYGAYRVGAWVTGEAAPQQPMLQGPPAHAEAGFWERVRRLGKPLLVGLAITATVSGLLAYGVIHVGWRLWLRHRRRRSRP
jgi:uncharacterized protein (DUF2062 family)